jgi:3-oxoacyl-[acyl-carrier protein] reductase
MVELAGRTALVTGGSRGIGAATARQLARLGAHVVLTYRNSRTEADAVAAECGGTECGSAAVLHADLEGQAGVDALLAELHEAAPAIDIVVDNAGASIPRAGLLACPTEQLTDKVAGDVAILHRLIQSLVPSMHRRGFGRVIAITSGHALGPSAPDMAAHGVSKAAIEALVHYAATELGHDGVTINAIRPGFVSTDSSRDVPEQIREAMTRTIPAGRLATAQDIASIVALIAQPASQWVNGVAIPAAGGLNYPTDWARVYPAAYT